MVFNSTDGFLKMLSRFRKGQSDAPEQEAMETWYDSLDNPDVDYVREPDASDKIWAKIHQRTGGNALPQSRTGFRQWYRIAAAAVVACGLLGYYFVYQHPTGTHAVSGTVMHENKTASVKEILLPDHSKVVLQPGARIWFSPGFNKETRTVQLKGDAFFSVTKNKTVPFIVNATGIRTRVLGTEFTISEHSGMSQVEVISGKVQVQALDPDGRTKSSAGQVVLTANLKATYRTNSDELIVGLVDTPQKTGPASTPSLTFYDKPLRELIGQLEKEYGVEIRTENPEIRNCPVTADLSGETLPSQLEIITGALNAQFTVDQQGILIRGGGCGPLPGSQPARP